MSWAAAGQDKKNNPRDWRALMLFIYFHTLTVLKQQILASFMNACTEIRVNGNCIWWFVSLYVISASSSLKSRKSSQSELEFNQLHVEKGRIPLKRYVFSLSFVQHHLLNSRNHIWKVCSFEQLLNRKNYRRLLNVFTKEEYALLHLLITYSKSTEFTSCRCQAPRTKQHVKRKNGYSGNYGESKKLFFFLGHWKQATHRKCFLFHSPPLPTPPRAWIVLCRDSLKASPSLLNTERECNCFFHIPMMMRETKIHFLHKCKSIFTKKAICHSLKLLLRAAGEFVV